VGKWAGKKGAKGHCLKKRKSSQDRTGHGIREGGPKPKKKTGGTSSFSPRIILAGGLKNGGRGKWGKNLPEKKKKKKKKNIRVGYGPKPNCGRTTEDLGRKSFHLTKNALGKRKTKGREKAEGKGEKKKEETDHLVITRVKGKSKPANKNF